MSIPEEHISPEERADRAEAALQHVHNIASDCLGVLEQKRWPSRRDRYIMTVLEVILQTKP